MGEEFEVHGPHHHAIEHIQEFEVGSMASRIAVMTAVLASIGTIAAYESGSKANLALFHKNEAAIYKTDASNQWAFFQAKSQKENLAELGAELTTGMSEKRNAFETDVARYQNEKAAIQQHAEKIEKDVVEQGNISEALMHEHHRWAQATALMQIAIALSAIALLTRRKWLVRLAETAGVVGILLCFVAFFGW